MKHECDISMVSQSSQAMLGLPLRSPADSQRAQEVHRTPSEFNIFPCEISSNMRESSDFTADNETDTNLASNFQTVQDPLDAATNSGMTFQGHASSREMLYANTPYISLGNSSTASLPSWDMAESSAMVSVESNSLGRVHIQCGIPRFSQNAGNYLEVGNEVSRQFLRDSANSVSEGFQISNSSQELIQENLPFVPQENCILSRFRAIHNARNSYVCTETQHLGSRGHSAGTCESLASREGGQRTYTSEEQLLGISLDGAEIYRNTSVSSSSGSSKRKICAVGNFASDSSAKISAYTSTFSGTSDPVLLEAVGNSRHFNNGPLFGCVDSAFGKSSESAITSVESSNIHGAQAHLQLEEQLPTDVSNVCIDEHYRGVLLGSILGENERIFPAETAGSGTSSFAAHQSASNLNPVPMYRRAVQAQPDLRLSRRIQYEPSTSSLQMNADFSTFLPSSSVISDGHGTVRSANSSRRRERISVRQTDNDFESDVRGDRLRRNVINASRGGRSGFISSSANEVVRRSEAMNHADYLHNDVFEILNPMNPSIHAIPLTNGDSSHGFSENRSSRARSRMPSLQHRHQNGLMSETSFTPSVLSSATSGNFGFSTASERPLSSSRVLRRLMLSRESLLDALGDRLPSSIAGSLIGLPFQRLGVAQTMEDEHYRVVDDEIHEQMLMLEATILFSGIGLQDQFRDLRLDVDNMSYEELLALEERIGDVCTGLSEEVITQKLTMSKFIAYNSRATSGLQDPDMKCSICQEEYEDGNELGGLICGHSYHTTCIKQWLILKNLCPVCKATAIP